MKVFSFFDREFSAECSDCEADSKRLPRVLGETSDFRDMLFAISTSTS